MNADHGLFCRIGEKSAAAREQERLHAVKEFGLLEPGSTPVFEETTQTAAHFLNVPVCVLGLMGEDQERLKSAIGLSRLGFMNDLATSRALPRSDSFCTHVVDSHQVLAIEDTLKHPFFANSLLTHRYGIRAYLGVPLMTSAGLCVGTLAVMDLVPRSFTSKEVEFLELTARWSVSEFERQLLLRQNGAAPVLEKPAIVDASLPMAQQVRVDLLSQLTQELRTPLTSVMGMASVLNREIYGPLTTKQKEYLDIIHSSGEYLLLLVNEILELSALNDSGQELNLTSVDIEMLCQRALSTLEQAAHRREQQVRLSVEPGRRVWLLDKAKVRQMLYHLIFSVIQSSTAGSVVRLHVSRKSSSLNFAVWVSHPWLGEGIYCEEAPPRSRTLAKVATAEGQSDAAYWAEGFEPDDLRVDFEVKPQPAPASSSEAFTSGKLNQSLGILLCRQLAELHGGRLMIQTVMESGYRYVISLPQVGDSSEEL